MAIGTLLTMMSGAKKGVKIAQGPLAKQAGIIAPALGAEKILGIESVVDRALDMTKSGKSPWAVGVESEKALRNMRNPGDALSVFIGPEGIPRIKIDPKNARIASDAPVRAYKSYDESAAVLSDKVKAKHGDLIGPAVPLTDYLLHPSLYAISPAAASAKVQHNQLLDLFGHLGGYNEGSNIISLPARTYGTGRTKNDPMGELLETLLHEATHGIQAESKIRTGGKADVLDIRNAITEARTKGSFRTPQELDKIESYLSNISAMSYENQLKQARLDQLYKSIYGEWEARQASQYGRSLPMMNERGATF